MKKTPKKVLGFLGLGLVAAMTFFAAISPNPEALAASSVTDTITVRVLAGSPDVNIDSPKSGSVFVSPNQTIAFDFSKSDSVLVTMEKKMPSGSPQIYTLYSSNPGQEPGDDSVGLDLSEPIYGYGEYTVRIRGTLGSSLMDEDTIKFSYLPVSGEVEEDDSGKIETILNYDNGSVDLSHFVIKVYDDNGNLVSSMPAITVEKPTKTVELPFAKNKVPSGKYIVSIEAYDTNGELVYNSYDVVFIYEPVRVPNTGGLFQGSNISKDDYLITGLIVFSVVGIAGVVFIAKGRRNTRK